MVIVPPCKTVVPLAPVVRVLKPVTAPPSLVTPVVVVVRVNAVGEPPVTVEFKLTFPAAAEDVKANVAALDVTASLYVCDPVVVTDAPLIAVVPLAEVVKLVRAVVAPMVPVKVVVPASLIVRA